ncbi:MAG TPA: hypothetical protein DCM02_07045 [Flavobacterium sp.]|nr:hypothetical protein [Flavobacterium sp.]HAT77449.1 hypothetical protein [Flavobacterium sp.]HAT80990.1 hypothetical protein [Flavobacterium sp.]
MLKSEIEYLRHIKEETSFIIEQTNSITEDDFSNNIILRKAIIRSLEVIGEATKRVNFDFRAKYNAIPWKEMAGLRDKLIHDYTGVDYPLVWKICTESIPELDFQIEEIIKERE